MATRKLNLQRYLLCSFFWTEYLYLSLSTLDFISFYKFSALVFGYLISFTPCFILYVYVAISYVFLKQYTYYIIDETFKLGVCVKTIMIRIV